MERTLAYSPIDQRQAFPAARRSRAVATPCAGAALLLAKNALVWGSVALTTFLLYTAATALV